jgi:DNA-binding XRE family transcriptional regulator
VVNFLDKDTPELKPEDVIKGALAYYLERFYDSPITEHQEKLDLLQLMNGSEPIKNRIGELIEKKSSSATTMAEELNISKGTISGIINNKHQPSLDIFIRIYIWLGCPPIDEILYREKSS